MSRYINADAIEYHEIYDGQEFVRVAYGDDIDNIPTADVAEVVRCKECKWHGYLTCSNPDGVKGWVTDNDFCSYGEEGEFVRKRR